MKNFILLFFFLVIAHFTYANENSSNDFSQYDDKKEILSSEEIRSRVEIFGEVFLTDPQGKLLLQAKETRLWSFGKKGNILSNWSFSTPFIKNIALKHTWSINDNGELTAHLQQYDSMKMEEGTRNVITGKLLREEKINIKDFAAISWVAHENKDERVIVRLSPRLKEFSKTIEASNVPIMLKNPIIYDNQSRVWATRIDLLEEKYVSIKSHVGMIAISFHPFKGAKEIGRALQNEITLEGSNDLKIYIRSEALIFPSSQPVKVYGIIDLNKKTASMNSLQSSSSSKEDKFLKHIK